MSEEKGVRNNVIYLENQLISEKKKINYTLSQGETLYRMEKGERRIRDAVYTSAYHLVEKVK